MLIIGEKEMNENMVSIRRQGQGDLGSQSVESFVEALKIEISERVSG